MNALLIHTLLWWLAQNTLTLVVLIPLVVLACRLFRHRPAVQHLLWVVVLLKFLTPPLVAWPWSLDEVRASLWPAEDSSIAAWWAGGHASDPNAGNFADRPASDFDLATENRIRFAPERPLAAPALDSVELARLQQRWRAETGALDRDLAEFPASGNAPWSSQAIASALWLVAGLWLLGAGVCLARHVRRIVQHAGLVRQAAPAPPNLSREIEIIARSLRLRPPRALLSPRIRSPFVWCFGRIRLVWPAVLGGSGEVARSRGVIAHELAHIRRGDHLVAWLELVALVVWWWNPLFWYARRRLRESAEMACDCLAIAAFPDQRGEYAELLLQLSTDCESSLPAPVLAVGALSPASFERRLTMILSSRASGKVSARGILLAMGLALVAVPGWALGQPDLASTDTATPDTTSPSADSKPANTAATEPAVAVPAPVASEAAPPSDPNRATEPQAENHVPANPTGQSQQSELPKLAFTDANDFNLAARVKKLEAENRRLMEMLHVLTRQAKTQTKASKWPEAAERPAEKNSDAAEAKKKAWLKRDTIVEYNRRGQATVKLTLDAAQKRAVDDLQTIRKRLEELQAQQPPASQEVLAQAKDDLAVAEKQMRAIQAALQEQVDAEVAAAQPPASQSLLDQAALRERVDAEVAAQQRIEAAAQRQPAKAEYAAILKTLQARAVEQQQMQKSLAEKAAAQAKTAQEQAHAIAKQAEDARANALAQLAPARSFAPTAPDNPLDIAERYLRAEADLKTARGRLSRIQKAEASGAVPQQEIEDLKIELERADKLCRLLTSYIQEARKSAAAAKEAAQGEYNRTEQLYKAAAISRSELDSVKARLDEADSRVRQFEAIDAIVPQATSTAPQAK